jgi:hypothetical protein
VEELARELESAKAKFLQTDDSLKKLGDEVREHTITIRSAAGALGMIKITVAIILPTLLSAIAGGVFLLATRGDVAHLREVLLQEIGFAKELITQSETKMGIKIEPLREGINEIKKELSEIRGKLPR